MHCSKLADNTGEICKKMNSFKKLVNQYGHYFVDIWQYLVIIIIFILAAIFIL
jgi:hypothetical protein